jgi:hypothetical protein
MHFPLTEAVNGKVVGEAPPIVDRQPHVRAVLDRPAAGKGQAVAVPDVSVRETRLAVFELDRLAADLRAGAVFGLNLRHRD